MNHFSARSESRRRERARARTPLRQVAPACAHTPGRLALMGNLMAARHRPRLRLLQRGRIFSVRTQAILKRTRPRAQVTTPSQRVPLCDALLFGCFQASAWEHRVKETWQSASFPLSRTALPGGREGARLTQANLTLNLDANCCSSHCQAVSGLV